MSFTIKAPRPVKPNWINVKRYSFRALRCVFDLEYIPTMRVGDTLPVPDRDRLALCLRYWRGIRHKGDVIAIKVPPKQEQHL